MKPNHPTSASQTTTLVFLLGIALLMAAPLSATAQDEGTVVRSLPANVDCEAGATFTVTLSLNPASGDDKMFLDETPPAGTIISGVSVGEYIEDQHRIKAVFLPGTTIPQEVTYDVTVPVGTPTGTVLDFTNVDLEDNSTWHYRFGPSMDHREIISGDTTVECANLCPNGPDGTFHTHDANLDGIMNDDDLFDLIDAWRLSTGGELDDLLFAGIDAWKMAPGSYC